MSQKLDLVSLELFIAVCECKSITQAAELRNLTPSAVSKRIAHLEQFVGSPLFLRNHSGVEPTNEGARLLDHARSVIYGIEVIERELVRHANNLRSCLRILANRSANAEFVPSLVASFLANPRYRGIDVHIAEATSHEVVSGVRAGLAVIGVCWAETDMEAVEWLPARRDSLSVVVPSSHPLARRRQIAFAESLEYDHVGIHSGGPVTTHLRRESVRSRKSLRYRVVAPTFDAMIQFVEARVGIAVMPTEVATRFSRSSSIVVIPLTDAWKERQFAVCCRSRRALSKPAAQLFDQLAAAPATP
jgi:DNA-binding transcriptional LysR family regulator